MCKPGGGANRCFIHKMGTKATVTMAFFTTNAPEPIIRTTAKELKKEGRNLPTPAQEEVRAFTMSQAFAAKHGMGIPDSHRDRLVRQWHSAAEEQPDGGTMHAWRNTAVRSVLKWRRTVMASIAGASLVATSACGAMPNQSQNTDTSAPTTTISAPASPSNTTGPASPSSTLSPSTSQSPSAGPVDVTKSTAESLAKSGMKLSGTTVETKYGSYPQTEMTEDNQLVKDQNLKAVDAPSGWTQDDVAKGAVFGTNTVFNMSVDHRFNSDETVTPQLFNQWKKAHASKIGKSLSSEYQSVTDPSTLMMTHAPWTQAPGFKEAGFNYLYDGKTPRVRSSHYTVKDAYAYNGGVYYEIEGPVVWNTTTKDGTNIAMKSTVNIKSVVTKEGGEFKISGMQSTMTTSEGEIKRIAAEL